jgi:hypothetical protein
MVAVERGTGMMVWARRAFAPPSLARGAVRNPCVRLESD